VGTTSGLKGEMAMECLTQGHGKTIKSHADSRSNGGITNRKIGGPGKGTKLRGIVVGDAC